MCKRCGLPVTPAHPKNLLIKALAFGKVKQLSTEEKTKVAISKEKPPIEPGVSAEDLFQHYYSDELVDWCTEHEILVKRNKTCVIKAIIKYLVFIYLFIFTFYFVTLLNDDADAFYRAAICLC